MQEKDIERLNRLILNKFRNFCIQENNSCTIIFEHENLEIPMSYLLQPMFFEIEVLPSENYFSERILDVLYNSILNYSDENDYFTKDELKGKDLTLCYCREDFCGPIQEVCLVEQEGKLYLYITAVCLLIPKKR